MLFLFWQCSPCSISDGVSMTCVLLYHYLYYFCLLFSHYSTCWFTDVVTVSCVVCYPWVDYFIILFIYYLCSPYSDIIHHADSVMVWLWHIWCTIATLISFVFIFSLYYFWSSYCDYPPYSFSDCVIMSCAVWYHYFNYFIIFCICYLCFSYSCIVHHTHSVTVWLWDVLCCIGNLISFVSICILLLLLILLLLFEYYPSYSFSDGVTMSCVLWYPYFNYFSIFSLCYLCSSYSDNVNHAHSVTVWLWHVLCCIGNLISFVCICILHVLFLFLLFWYYPPRLFSSVVPQVLIIFLFFFRNL